MHFVGQPRLWILQSFFCGHYVCWLTYSAYESYFCAHLMISVVVVSCNLLKRFPHLVASIGLVFCFWNCLIIISWVCYINANLGCFKLSPKFIKRIFICVSCYSSCFITTKCHIVTVSVLLSTFFQTHYILHTHYERCSDFRL